MGPVGSILACHMSGIGIRLVLVDASPERLHDLAIAGLRLSGTSACLPIEPVAVSSPGEAAPLGPFDAVLVCVKAPDLSGLVPELIPIVGSDTLVASFQNGLGTEDILAEAFGFDRTARAVVNFAGALGPGGTVCRTFFHPPNHLGGMSPVSGQRAMALADLLTSAGLHTDWVEDVRPHVWRKVVHLAILAPICAITHLDMRSALRHKELRRLSQGLLDECLAVGERLGFDCGNGFFEGSMSYVLEAGDHAPSMLVDILRGRPTEVGFINGKVVEAGDRLGVPVPLNRAIAALVTGIEAGIPAARERFGDVVPTT
jgi:2-dehydropantoate 2-reductase